MQFEPGRILLLAAAGLIASAAAAQDCETLRAQIESKIRANGVTRFSLEVVDPGATARGRVVGSCGKGSRRIVYVVGQDPGTPSRPGADSGAKRTEPLLTECRDGTVTLGGDCRRR